MQCKLVIEFRNDRADFQRNAYRTHIEQVLRVADEFVNRAVIERDQLKVCVQL